jgi:hypothetical protein
MKTEHTLYTLRNTESGHTPISWTNLETIMESANKLKQNPSLDEESRYVIEKTVTTVEVTQVGDVIVIPARTWTVQSMIDEVIGFSEGQRDFYFPEAFKTFSPEDQELIKQAALVALDYCDHCGHLVDAPELSENDYGSRLCDMCYSDEEEEEAEDE